MKTRTQGLFLGLAAAVILSLEVSAQNFTTLQSFTGGSSGARPWAGLVLSGNTLYGTTREGSTSSGGVGTVFAINSDGSGFATLHDFVGPGLPGPSFGGGPFAGLILMGNTLFGTTCEQGDFGNGSVFALVTDGSGFTNLHSFTPIGYGGVNSDGAYPMAGLILQNTQPAADVGGGNLGHSTSIIGNTNGAGSILYGTTYYGGSTGNGTVFALNADGTGFKLIHTFSADTGYNNGGLYINSDGGNPMAGLILSGNTLYGTTHYGGSAGNGAVFAVNTDGTGFKNLHSFSETWANANSDGAVLNAGLILAGATLYGTATTGGSWGQGVVFAVNTDGSGFTNLHSFNGSSDGADPETGLILWGNTLYGTTRAGGGAANGTVFALNTDGTSFANLHTFTSLQGVTDSDGANPQGGLISSGGTLFGTTSYGGSAGYGTVFALDVVPSLNIALTNNNLVVSWPAWARGYTLQWSTNLGSTGEWHASPSAPIVVNGRNVVITSTSGTQRHFRLALH